MMRILKTLTRSAMMACLVILLSASVALAATLSITSIGGVSTGTGTLTTFTTTKNNPTFLGEATPDATVDITIDDLTVAVLANATGDWSYTPVGLTDGSHTIKVISNLETITFTLTVNAGTDTTTATESSTTSKGGVSTSSAQGELPKSGAFENTVLMVAAGMFLMGLGVVAHQYLPLSSAEEE